jgi:hypothetical protein
MCYQKQELLTLRGAHSTPSFSNLVINQKYKKKTMYIVYVLSEIGILTLRGAHSTPSFSNLVINQKLKKKTMYVVYVL